MGMRTRRSVMSPLAWLTKVRRKPDKEVGNRGRPRHRLADRSQVRSSRRSRKMTPGDTAVRAACRTCTRYSYSCVGLGSTIDQHGDVGMREYLDGFASKHNCRNTTTPMRCHRDEITAFCIGGLYDSSVGVLVLDVGRGICDPRGTRYIGNGFKNLRGVRFHAPLVLRRRVLDHLRVGRQNMEWHRNRQDGDFCADLLGQGDAMLDRLVGECRSVGRY